MTIVWGKSSEYVYRCTRVSLVAQEENYEIGWGMESVIPGACEEV